MGIFTGQRERLLRTEWSDAQSLAEELYAMFGSKDPIQVDSPLAITTPADVQPLTFNIAARAPDAPWVYQPWASQGSASAADSSAINLGGVGGSFVNIGGNGGQGDVTIGGSGGITVGGGGGGGGGFIVPPATVQPQVDPGTFGPPSAWTPPAWVTNTMGQVFNGPVVFAGPAYVYNQTSAPFSWDGKSWPFDFPPPGTGELLPVSFYTPPTLPAVPVPAGVTIQPYSFPIKPDPGTTTPVPQQNNSPSHLASISGGGGIPGKCVGGAGTIQGVTLFPDGLGSQAGDTVQAEFLNLDPTATMPAGWEVIVVGVAGKNGKAASYYVQVPVWVK